MTTPPGWYPDPSGSGRQMYWDGRGWATPPPPPPAAKKSVSGKRVLLVLVALFIGFIVISAIGSKGDDKKASTSSSSSSHSIAAPASPTAAPAGSSVRDGKFEFRVLNMTRAATAGDLSNPYMIAKAQGEFIILTLSVKNIGNEPQSYFGDNQKLIDSSGRQYGVSSDADLWMNESLMGDINPGNQIQVKVAFDVPPGTVPAELEVHDSMFSGGTSVQL